MSAESILKEIESKGVENYKRMLFKNYGVKEPCFGVKISELKKIQRRVKKDYQLALDLYETGNYDAMYLAGLIADDARMTKQDLNRWVRAAYGGALGGSVAAVAAGSPCGHELAIEWIESSDERVASVGWNTLAGLAALKDAELDLLELKQHLERVRKTIHQSSDWVRYAMNAFVIAVGCYVKELTGTALEIAEEIGPVTAHLGNNSCEVPFAPAYIRKVQQRGTTGIKRKSLKC